MGNICLTDRFGAVSDAVTLWPIVWLTDYFLLLFKTDIVIQSVPVLATCGEMIGEKWDAYVNLD